MLCQVARADWAVEAVESWRVTELVDEVAGCDFAVVARAMRAQISLSAAEPVCYPLRLDPLAAPDILQISPYI